MNPERAMKLMHKFGDMQRLKANQFLTTQKATITDLYRLDQSIENRKRTIGRIEHLLYQKRLLPPDSAQYAQIMSELSVEAGILKAVDKDTQGQIEDLKSATQTQMKISEGLVAIKKKLQALLRQLP